MFVCLKRFAANLRPYRGTSAIIFCGLLLEMSFASAVPFSFKFIVDNALLGKDFRLLLIILAALGSGVVVVALVGLGRDYLYARLTAGIMGSLRQRMFEHLQWLSMDYYARSEAGEVLSRFSTDLAVVENATAAAVPWAILPGLDVASSSVLLFVLDWRLALVAMLVWPLTLVGPRIFAPRVSEASYRRKIDEARILTFVQQNMNAQPILRTFELTDWALAGFRGENARLHRSMVRVGFFGALVERSAGVGIMFLQVAIMGLGSYMVMQRTLSLGSLAAFQALFLSLGHSLSYVTQYVPNLVQASGGLRRIGELLNEAPSVQDRPGADELAQMSREITFRGVRFGYSSSELQLKGVDLSISKGESVAFVGSSGSGKSTILSLVMRFYDPQSGSVSIDGRDLREVSLKSLHLQIGAVFQDSFLFNISIRENIRLGRPEASDAEVEEATRAAGLDDDIASLPQRYDTLVGERGSRLSGGQRQRIAIARAIIHDPEILILDEATSALDPATEAAVNATLSRAVHGRTTLSVTHRLASVVEADRIFVMDAGEIREQGRHEELLARVDSTMRSGRNSTASV
jgi:ATP-binding cassette subfamily B protein